MAPYTEACCTAAAAAATWFALHRCWGRATLLTTLACSVRINGLFLLVALLVIFILQCRAGAQEFRPRSILLRLAPALAPAAYLARLWANTGDLFYWLHIQHEGWGREYSPLWSVIGRSVTYVTSAPGVAEAFQQIMELLFLGIWVGVVAYLARRRLLGLAAFAGVTLGSLITGPILLSVPRNCWGCFPVLLGLAAGSEKLPRSVRPVAWTLAVALLSLNCLSFTSAHWTG